MWDYWYDSHFVTKPKYCVHVVCQICIVYENVFQVLWYDILATSPASRPVLLK